MEDNLQMKHTGIKTIQETKEENKYYHKIGPKKRIFFNSVTGEEINLDYENEEDMYCIMSDLEEYSEDIVEGGFGISIVKDLAKTTSYEYKNGHSYVVITL